MMPAQPIVYAVTMFLALTSLLRWKCLRQSPYHRLRRGLQMYRVRVLSELSANVTGTFSTPSAKAA